MAALFVVFLPILAVLLVIYLGLTWKLDYWKKRNVPHLKPKLFFGNYKDLITFKKSLPEVTQDICRQFPNEPYIGTYYGTEPALLVHDPELLKLIVAKDFSYFSGRENDKHTHKETFTQNMFFRGGDKWKVARQNISPLFSSSKLKNMFPLIQEKVPQFEELLKYETNMSQVLDSRKIMARFTMESICSMVFGVNVNVLAKDVENNQFYKIGALIFEVSNARGTALNVRAMWPALFYGAGFEVFPKKITDFFEKLVFEVFESRGYKPSSRNDFVDLLLGLKENEYLNSECIIPANKGQKVSVKVDREFLSSQCSLFFAAGYETSATSSSALLFQLAKDQEAQEKVVKEINEYLQKRGGNIEYDCITELPYLEACLSEAMRLNPVLGLLTREVMDTYTLPTGLVLEKGLRVHIPVYHLHMNPAFFPDPEKFKPERFLGGNKDSIIPYTYMPFGEGHRICLGMRVGKMQMIPGLITVLRNYRLELPEGREKYSFEPRSLVFMSQDGLPVKFLPRN